MPTCIRCGEGIPLEATSCPRIGNEVLWATPPLKVEQLRHPTRTRTPCFGALPLEMAGEGRRVGTFALSGLVAPM
jgi:hypothetical protein